MTSGTTSVCVLTGRQMAAIGSVAIAGADAGEVLERIFKTGRNASAHTPKAKTFRNRLEAGGTLHGMIVDGDRVVDEVVVGCEGPESFVIHCHGNPLLSEQIVKLAQSYGAVLTDAEHFSFERHRGTAAHLIEAEAKLAMQQCATLAGVKILQAQIDGGLSGWVKQTLENIDTVDTEQIKRECAAVLGRSRVAAYFTKGVRIVIAGPPNAGKSTLLNALAGQQQAIVSQTAGTTRDWVSVVCELNMPAKTDNNGPSLRAEFIDTAGLDDVLADAAGIDSQAQQVTRELLDACDLILYVQDATTLRTPNTAHEINVTCPVISVYNKCDRIEEHTNTSTQGLREQGVSVFISARDAVGIDLLAGAIFKVLGADDFHDDEPVVFTVRQRTLLEKMCEGQPPKSCLEQMFG